MSPPRQWLQLRHLSQATGVDRRTLKTWADAELLPFTRFAGTGWRLFGADAIETLERMGVPVNLAVLAVLTDSTIPTIDEDNEGNEDTDL